MDDNKGGVALLVGGVLIIIATFLTFVTLKGPGGEESFTAGDAEEAAPYYFAAGIALIAGIVAFLDKSGGRAVGKIFAVIAILGVGFFGLYASIVDITDIESFAPEGSGVEASTGLGAYIALVGSVVAIIGAVLCLKGGATTVTTTPTAPPPTGPPPTSTPPPA